MAQWLAHLCPDPTALGLNQGSRVFYTEKILMLLC